MKFGKKWTKIEAWGLPQLVVCKNLSNLLLINNNAEIIIYHNDIYLIIIIITPFCISVLNVQRCKTINDTHHHRFIIL